MKTDVLPKPTRGRFKVRETFAALLSHQAGTRAAGTWLGDAKTAMVEAKARIAAIEAEKRAGETIAATEIEAVFDALWTRVIAALESLPGRCAFDLAGTSDPALVRDRLKGEIRSIRQAISDELLRRATDGFPVANRATQSSE